MSAEDRAEKLGEIRKLLSDSVRPIDESLVEKAPSPFVPDSGKKVVVEEKVEVVLTDEELLKELSNYVNPTGIFMFGGEFYLIFKEKKLKMGSGLGITYNGAEYSVNITEITGSTYKISRGDSELQLKLK
ncbi:hypothetical protein [Pelagicoccus sp. SDUM812002]|uniref:hypothetical protein n=1 Tax=Pelagicoccus sp. SDUM812002 TaxID=3041266 RepID=UPI00280CB809|nr:hypothetical protein [Pelagicoccus sp. SDUM812002]MDQ8186101.1 hypothetical protein [Pelagicoccus sp. SDUM812002]